MYNPTFEQTTKFLKEDVYALYNLLMDSNGEIVDLDLTEIKSNLVSLVSALDSLQEYGSEKTLQDIINTIILTKKDELPVASGDKNVTTAGVAEALSADEVCTSVSIQAKTTNTGSITVGTSSARPFTLEAKDFISFPCTNLNQVYIDSSVSGEGVGYVALGVVS